MKKLLFIFIALCSIPSFGQDDLKVDQAEFIEELQKWNINDTKMSLSFWIPQSYWRVVLSDNPEVPEESIGMIEDIFKDYILVCAADVSIGLDGTFTYKSEPELKSEIKLVDSKKDEYIPLTDNEMSPDVKSMLDAFAPMFAKMLGQMGEGMHFYVFENKNSKKKVLVDENENTELTIKHSSFDFKWTLPLVSLSPPKYCPIDDEKMKSNWKYCPIHGVELEKEK